MAQTGLKKKQTEGKDLLLRPHAAIAQKILNQTSGMWRGRRMDVITYQRAMRKSYPGHTATKK